MGRYAACKGQVYQQTLSADTVKAARTSADSTHRRVVLSLETIAESGIQGAVAHDSAGNAKS